MPAMRTRNRVLLAVAGAAVAALGACHFLLPERLAVNAPLAHMLLGRGVEPPPPDELERRLQVPAGFSVTLYARGIAGARFMRRTAAGDLLVSQPRAGRVALVRRDADGDGAPDGLEPVIEGLNRPHGLDLSGPWLYIAETDAVGRIRFDAATGKTRGEFERIVTGLPAGGNHWSRTIRFGPDGGLYVSIGSSCNACVEDDPRRAAMMRFEADGSGGEIFATGLRNSVGFDWQPGTGHLFATDNGRDLLGDDFPPCELNRVERHGFYGWPFANGDRVQDPDLGAGREERIRTSRPPAHGFRAHTAPLGITFLRGESWPEHYRNAALVALHGSWNRRRKDGYEVASLHWKDDGSIEERPFLVGFLENDDVIGRPVDVVEDPEGVIYVSDDYAGAIYRVVAGSAPSPSRRAAVAPLGAGGDPLADLPAPEREARSARGRQLYERHACAGCHEPERAEPGVVAVPLRALGARFDVEGLVAFLATPTPPMPVPPLDEAGRRDLAVFLLAEEAQAAR